MKWDGNATKWMKYARTDCLVCIDVVNKKHQQASPIQFVCKHISDSVPEMAYLCCYVPHKLDSKVFFSLLVFYRFNGHTCDTLEIIHIMALRLRHIRRNCWSIQTKEDDSTWKRPMHSIKQNGRIFSIGSNAFPWVLEASSNNTMNRNGFKTLLVDKECMIMHL